MTSEIFVSIFEIYIHPIHMVKVTCQLNPSPIIMEGVEVHYYLAFCYVVNGCFYFVNHVAKE